jgi:cell division septum initiation protein DivIVA
MPDQSSAASEHAILQEITVPLETLPDDPEAVVNADFPAALRGYDRLAVDEYVRHTSQLIAELQSTRSPDAAIRRALERLGEQISGILQRAHDTAEQITTQSRADAEDRVEAARREAVQIAAAAEQRVRDLDADTDRIWSERHRIVDDTKDLASQLLALTETAAERFPAAEEADPGVPVYDAEAGPAATLGGDQAFGEPEPEPEPEPERDETEATAVFTVPADDETEANAARPEAGQAEAAPRGEETEATAAFAPPEFDEEPTLGARQDDGDPAFPPSTPGGTRGLFRK